MKRATPSSLKIKKILELLNLQVFHEQSNIDDNLLNLFNKLNNIKYINEYVLSIYPITNLLTLNYLSFQKDLVFTPLLGLQTIGI